MSCFSGLAEMLIRESVGIDQSDCENDDCCCAKSPRVEANLQFPVVRRGHYKEIEVE